jgi:hypothetical protein
MSAPLHLSEVLEEEYVALSGRAVPPEERSWLLRPAQVRDPAALLARLRDPSDRVSQAIWARIQASRGEPGDAAALVAALNVLLQEPRVLYDVEPTRDLDDEELGTLLAQKPTGEDLIHANRLLLDAACRGTIVPVHQARLVQAWRRMHAAKHAALCLSGGGVRSATFALGVLQGLARAGLLGGFHYLSTVSGGGFIGSWLAVWGHRHPDGAAGAVAALAARPEPGLTPEPRPIHRLREYSNYLSPRLGILSADTWVLGATYVRNLLLNWLVLLPVLVAVLAVPRLLVALYGVEPTSAGRLELLLVVGFLLNVLALAYVGYERPSYRPLRRTGRREGRGQGEFLIWCLAPLVGSALLFTIYWSWRGTPGVSGWDWAGFAGFGILLHLTAFCVYSWCLRRLNWTELIVIAGSGALGGLAGGVLADSVLPRVEEVPLLGATLAVPLVLGAVLVAATLFVGLASRGTTDEDREWWARAGAWMLIAIAGWSVPAAIVIWGPSLIAEVKTAIASVGGLAAFVTLWLGGSARTPAAPEAKKSSGIVGLVRDKAPTLAAPVFAVYIAIFLSLGTDWLLVWLDAARAHLPAPIGSARRLPVDATQHMGVIAASDAGLLVLLIVVLVLFSAGMSVLINVNKFSLHAMYRNRLIRAYLGATREPRHPNLFTGFDREDNVYLKDVVAGRPIHVINMALNLVGGEKLAWQERKAETFTVTALHAGSYHLGYRRSARYGGRDGMSIGTAAAISGAAASPNMGYHSSPIVTFLMTLFNARLGWWLGNPGVHGEGTYRRASPRLAFVPILAEALGLTDDRRRYVYLSDGGHFDNIGLIETVLRRCRTIVVSDAGCDPGCGFADLGAAIRKIRIDLGVSIVMGPMKVRSRGKPGAYCAVGRVRYSMVDGTSADDDGWLIYVKPVFNGDEPADVVAYAQLNREFPHEPTTDQWFSESQFESYRRLGEWQVEAILGAGAVADLDAFRERAERHVAQAS